MSADRANEARVAARVAPLPVWARGLTVTVAVAGAVMTTAAVLIAAQLPLAWKPQTPLFPDHAAGLMFPAVGAFVVAHRPRLLIGWLMAGGGLGCAVNVFCMALMLSSASSGDLESAGYYRIVGVVGWALGGGVLAGLVPLYSPDGRLPSRRWRPVAAFALAVTVTEGIRAAVRPTPPLTGYRLPQVIPNPLAIEALGPYNRAIQDFTMTGTLAAVVVALASLVLRFLLGDPTTRRQIAWPLAAFAGYVVFLLLGQDFWLPGSLWTGLLPIAIAFAVLRYRLYGIDTVISRTVVITGVVVIVGAVYFGVGGLAGMLVSGYDRVAGLGAALCTGVFFQPLVARLRRLTDLMMYGRHGDPRDLARRLAREIGATDPRGALVAVTEAVRDALGVTGVAVEPRGVPGAEAGRVGPSFREVPLVWHGEPVGRMLLGPPGPRRFASAYNDRLIRVLTPYVADVGHAVLMAADLQSSRERMLNAREEERRRLRRDLHDGLGQALANMSMSITVARSSLRGSPESADRLLIDLRSGMDSVSQEIRELVYGLRPPSLDDLGLAGAVRALAGEAGLPVTVTADGLPECLPAAMEVAVYRIVQEALTNVRKHSRARTAAVTVRHSPRRNALVITVRDDGRGLPPGHRPGVGFSSMRERAAELGGSCTITSQRRGVQVTAVLPLPGEQETAQAVLAREGPPSNGGSA
ncbi:sensor histidine kinase [Spongiactinospora sp. TRM90649]|uniref:sensor histidine kinase n=1 Tax=Spongiactinospora sp. TRM90649 TaxID=3031114 RepID=UPI0023F9B5F9|nr:sensor histidine kinase [Spongiactinospora sp. TRM90649]MDF5755650.1 sensor histidine kinase [Spongiactinospora sp. TRM90649]